MLPKGVIDDFIGVEASDGEYRWLILLLRPIFHDIIKNWFVKLRSSITTICRNLIQIIFALIGLEVLISGLLVNVRVVFQLNLSLIVSRFTLGHSYRLILFYFAVSIIFLIIVEPDPDLILLSCN